MRFIIFGLCLSLAACAPRLAFSNEAGGVIQRSGSIGSDRAFALAQDHCSKFGKNARITNQKVLTNTWTFECASQ